MYSARSFQLTEGEFNYLLPVLKNKLTQSGYFVAQHTDDLTDMLNRLKGFYGNYDDLKSMIVYNCHKNRSIDDFRTQFNNA